MDITEDKYKKYITKYCKRSYKGYGKPRIKVGDLVFVSTTLQEKIICETKEHLLREVAAEISWLAKSVAQNTFSNYNDHSSRTYTSNTIAITNPSITTKTITTNSNYSSVPVASNYSSSPLTWSTTMVSNVLNATVYSAYGYKNVKNYYSQLSEQLIQNELLTIDLYAHIKTKDKESLLAFTTSRPFVGLVLKKKRFTPRGNFNPEAKKITLCEVLIDNKILWFPLTSLYNI
jgi:hypothetical protein